MMSHAKPQSHRSLAEAGAHVGTLNLAVRTEMQGPEGRRES